MKAVSDANLIPDAEVPMLASSAAIEFDRAHQRRAVGFDAAKELGAFMKQGALRDVVAESLVFQALTASGWNSSIHTVPEAEREAMSIADLLIAAETLESKDWVKLRDFCSAFAHRLVAYKQSIRGYQPVSPLRR